MKRWQSISILIVCISLSAYIGIIYPVKNGAPFIPTAVAYLLAFFVGGLFSSYILNDKK
jgi:hypothetical protein